MNEINLKTKVQAIYFQTTKNDLGIKYATSDKRITIVEAEKILSNRQVDFEEVLKVKYEYLDITLPIEELEKYIIK